MSLTLDATRWALQFYRDHFWLVFGLSLIPGLQRFATLRRGGHLPAAVKIGSETLVAAVRLLLLFLLVRIGFQGIEQPWWKRVVAGIEAEQTALYLQFAVLVVAFAGFSALPEAAIAKWVPHGRRDSATAIVLLVKNPTVIAFTLLWMVGTGVVLAMRGGEALSRL